MKLQGRNLSLQGAPSPQLQGDDVTLLQSELKQLGFDVPDDETASQSFGLGTSQAVLRFQANHELAATGIVDAATAQKINAAVDALHPQLSTVQGLVRRADGKSVGPITVRAFDVTSPGDGLLGEASINAANAYQIEYSSRSDQPPAQPIPADLIVRAFDNSGAVVASSNVIHNPGSVANVDLFIQEQSSASSATFIVRGQVRKADGRALSGALVRAVDKDMRTEQPLGESTADADGRYEIHYSSAQFSRDEKASADLIVRVFSGGSVTAPATPLVSSDILFNAPPIATIDLTVPDPNAGLSEFERLLASITPVCQGVSPDKFNDQDLQFLSRETGEARMRLKFLATAYQLEAGTHVQAAAFYGLFREGLPTTLPELLTQGASRWRRALTVAIASNIVPVELKDSLNEILGELTSLVVQSAFDQSTPDGNALRGLLATEMPDQKLRSDFLTQYLQHTGPIQDFWKNLATQPAFQNGVVENLQWTLWAGALARDHLPLATELQRRRKNGALSSLRDLAQLTEKDWLEMVNQPVNGKPIGFPPDVPGNTDGEKAANYAHTLARTIEIAFPTAVVAARLTTENAPVNKDLITFLKNNQNFDFGEHHVDVYLNDNPNALKDVGDPKTCVLLLESLQRVFTITPQYAEMKILLDDGLQSAQAVTRMSRDQFSAKYAARLGQDRAGQLYERASQVAAAALLFYGRYSSRFSIPLTVSER